MRSRWLVMVVMLSGVGAAGGASCSVSRGGSLPAEPEGIGAAVIAAGDYSRSLNHGGRERTYLLHVPRGYDGSREIPLVVMLHGGTGTAEGAARWYGWNEKADTDGFFAAYPDGVGVMQTWNAGHCCGAAMREGVDDVGFVVAMIEAISVEARVDRGRVFATGMSNGGMMCHRLGAERPDVFAAIAPVAGSIGGRAGAGAAEVKPGKPKGRIAVVIVHGTEDRHVLYGGGETEKGLVPGRVDLSVEDGVRFWVEANGCEVVAKREKLSEHVVRHEHLDRGHGADVVLYEVIEGGHAWPGSKKPWRGADEPSMEISATDEIWGFFARHPREMESREDR